MLLCFQKSGQNRKFFVPKLFGESTQLTGLAVRTDVEVQFWLQLIQK